MHPPATEPTGRIGKIGSRRRMRGRTPRSTPPKRSRRRRTHRQGKSWTSVFAGSRTGRKLKARTGIRFGALPSLCRNISLRHREYTGVLSGTTTAAVRPVSTDDARPDALVAQLDRASDSGSEGRGFESSRAHDAKPALRPGGQAFRMSSRRRVPGGESSRRIAANARIAAGASPRRSAVSQTVDRRHRAVLPHPGPMPQESLAFPRIRRGAPSHSRSRCFSLLSSGPPAQPVTGCAQVYVV